jgi:hypothetical protein
LEPLPNGFDLRDIFSGVRKAARVVWKGLNTMGVRYREGVSDPRRHSNFGKRT